MLMVYFLMKAWKLKDGNWLPMIYSYLNDQFLSCFTCVLLFVTLWTTSHQAPLFMGFSRQEYWSRLPCPPPGYLPDPGMDPPLFRLLHWQVGPLPLEPLGKNKFCYKTLFIHLSSRLSSRREICLYSSLYLKLSAYCPVQSKCLIILSELNGWNPYDVPIEEEHRKS